MKNLSVSQRKRKWWTQRVETMMNAKIAPKSDDKEKESTDKKEKKEEEETKKEEQDFLTRKCGWLCCGLCTDTYAV